MSARDDLLPVAQVPVLSPAELAAGMDDEDFFAYLQWLCAERSSDAFRADVALGPDDSIPYELTDSGAEPCPGAHMPCCASPERRMCPLAGPGGKR